MKVKLYTPYEHLKVVHSAITKHIDEVERFTEAFQKVLVVKAMRLVGKSAIAANELPRFSLKFKKSINGYLAPTLKLSRKMYREIVRMFKNTNLIESSNATELFIEFTNGSLIWFYSAELRDNLRGFNVSGLLVIDEAAFIPDLIYQEAVSPWCDAKKAVTLVLSTPKFKSGFFYKLYLQGYDPLCKEVESFDFSNYDVSCIRSLTQLEIKRKTLPTQVFKSEYLGIFLDAEGSVFGNFLKSINESVILKSNNLIDIDDNFDEIYLGLDFGTGSGKDSTVLTGLDRERNQKFIWATNTLSPTELVDIIYKIIESLNKVDGKPKIRVKRLLAELNSIGKVYIDMLKAKGILVQLFNTTNDSKRRIIENLLVLFLNNSITILNDVELLTQLSAYEQSVNSNNKVIYNAPTGVHDDYVIALGLANEAVSKAGFSHLGSIR